MNSRPKRNSTSNSKSNEETKKNKKNIQEYSLDKHTRQNKKVQDEKNWNEVSAYLLFKSYSWRKDTHGLFDYQEDKNKRTKCLIQPIEIEQEYFDSNNKEPTIYFQNQYSNPNIIKNQQTKFKSSQFLCFFRNPQNEINVIKIDKQDKDTQEVIAALSNYINNPIQQLICCAFFYQNPKTKKLNIKWYAGRQSNKIKSDLQKAELSQIPLINNVPYEVEKFSTPSLIVRSLKLNKFQEKGYELHLNDIVKMGRTQLQVVSIDGYKCHQMFDEEEKKAVNVPDKVTNLDQFGKEQEIQCKYCYMSIVEQDNFFLIPCKCSGFMSFVHYECLLNWIKSKVSIQTSKNVTMYMQNKLKCEVCLAQFPKFFRHKEKIYPIMPYKAGERHLMFKNISQKVQQRNGQLTVIINGVQNCEIKIGRAKQNQLRLTDITVSRQHASLKYMDGKYMIFDNRSKFGTTIRKKNEPLQMQVNEKWKGIQVGKTIIMAMFQKNQECKFKKQQKIEIPAQIKQIQDQNTNIYGNKDSNKKQSFLNVLKYKKVLYKNIQSEESRIQEQKKREKMERDKIINEFEQHLPEIQKRNQRSDDSEQNPLNLNQSISPNTPLLNPHSQISENINGASSLNLGQNQIQQEQLEDQQNLQDGYVDQNQPRQE